MKKYQVHVVAYNTLERLYQNLDAAQAKEKYIELCKRWYDEEGFESFIANNEKHKSEDVGTQYDYYYKSSEYYDADDNANVTLEEMAS